MKFKINGIDWKIEEKTQEEIKTIINTKKVYITLFGETYEILVEEEKKEK